MAARAAWGSRAPCLLLTSSRWHPFAFRSLKPFALDSMLTRSRLRIRCCAASTIGRSDDGPKSTGSGEDGPGLARDEQIVGSADKGHISLGGNLQDGIWQQVKDIAKFAGPAAGLWICSPMMSLIDTAVVGQSSAVELAALGPGTVVCDYLSFVFMFLSIATSNLVATSLARKDREEAQEHISMLLFVALVCGFGMLFVMKLFGNQILSAFIGPKNLHMVPAASSYIQIRGLAWPAVLVGMVAQSARKYRAASSVSLFKSYKGILNVLAMKDSFGPLKVLAIASLVNGFGDIILCSFWHYGIAGAAWATMVSQFIGAILMIDSLNKSGFSAFQLSIPSLSELLQIVQLAAPVFVTMFSKVAFYSFLTYFATSMGTITLAAHQVMIGVYSMCGVCGEPLSQTAQSFMPELIYGVKRNLEKARMLLQSLVTIGIIAGCILTTIGTVVPWLFPYIFTSDLGVSSEMRTVLLPYSIAIMITPPTLSLEGTLLAGRDLGFLSLSMVSCFCLGVLLLLIANKGFGLPGCWWALSVFQWARFLAALRRLTSPRSVLFSAELIKKNLGELKAT